VCGPSRSGGETIDPSPSPPGGVRSAICRIVESSKATFKFGDFTATKLLIHSLFSGCANWHSIEKGKGK
jgi:hypothetical protein